MSVSTLSSLALLSALNFTVLPTERRLFTSQSHLNGKMVVLEVSSNRLENMTQAGLSELVYNNVVLVPDSCQVSSTTIESWKKDPLKTARGILASKPATNSSIVTQTWYDLFFVLPVVFIYCFVLYRRRRQHYKDAGY